MANISMDSGRRSKGPKASSGGKQHSVVVKKEANTKKGGAPIR